MIPTVDYIRILPEVVLTIFGILVMLVDPLIPTQDSKKPLGVIALVGVLAGLAATLYQSRFYGDAFYHMVRVDAFSIFFHLVILLIALVVILSSFDYLEVQQIKAGEYYGLDPVRHRRHDADVVGHRTGADLHRPGNLVHLDLHSCGIPSARRRKCRVVAEVLPAGIVRHGVLPLRRRHGVWRDRDRPTSISSPKY